MALPDEADTLKKEPDIEVHIEDEPEVELEIVDDTPQEDKGRKPLADLISKRYGLTPVLPEYGDVIEI